MSEAAAHPEVVIRPLTAADVPAFLDLIEALAEFEHLPGPDAEARARLTADAVADPPRFRVLLAEAAGRAIGYAVYFLTYSTFLARPTLYLEDVFVLEPERRSGVGTAFLRALAAEALEQDCGRLEWQVLTWNAPAISFYEKLGATRLTDWHGYRLTADQIERLAESPAAESPGEPADPQRG
jgi:GNAT superfamily N-acetyltransferase